MLTAARAGTAPRCCTGGWHGGHSSAAPNVGRASAASSRASPGVATKQRGAAARAASSFESSSQPATTTVTVVDEYRPCVGVCIVNSQGLVFAATRVDDVKNTWQMPQGGIDEGEEPRDAALREVEEETGISSLRIIGEVDEWLTYDFSTKVRARMHSGWERFKGQEQKWFLAYFYGSDSEINLDTDHKEFNTWKWAKLEDLPGSVIEFKREVYEAVAEAFVPVIAKLKADGQLN